MTDRHEEAIEVAAEASHVATYQHSAGSPPEPAWDATYSSSRELYRFIARAAITAYMDHMHLTLTTVQDVVALPADVVICDRKGTIWQTGIIDGTGYLCGIGYEDGSMAREVSLPARVIWWGGDHA